MTALLAQTDAWLLGLYFGVAMLACWGLGWWIGRRRAADGGAVPDFKFDDTSLALLGLLLAFTFSMSLGKHDNRRDMGVADSNAIGDFYTCASMLKEPLRSELQGVIKRYAKHRYELPSRRLSPDEIQQATQEIDRMQGEMTELVAKALEAGTPAAVPLINTLNDVTSMNAARLAAIRDRLPPTIVALLFAAAIICITLIGRQQGSTGKNQTAGTLSFIALVSFVIFVTLDLNQPYRGVIEVSQETLHQLILSMGGE